MRLTASFTRVVGRLDLDLHDVAGGAALLERRCGEVFVPVGVGEGVVQQLVFVLFGGGVAACRRAGESSGSRCAEALDVGHDDDVGAACGTASSLASMPTAKARCRTPTMESRSPLPTGWSGRLMAMTTSAFMALRVVDGQVCEDGAVDELVAVELKRAEDAGDGGGGADRILQRAAGEGDGLRVRSGQWPGSGRGWGDR